MWSKKIYFWLKENGFNFDVEHEFDELLSDKGYPLRYDFCIIESGNPIFLIEFDGLQHEKYVEYFHINREGFNLLKKHDEIKNKFAKQKNIKLLRIGHRQIDSIEKILYQNLYFSLTDNDFYNQ